MKGKQEDGGDGEVEIMNSQAGEEGKQDEMIAALFPSLNF